MSPFHLKRAAGILSRGGVIAYPTEAVYGLGCDPSNETAVRRLLAIKGRPSSKGLILIASDFAQLQPLLQPLDDSQFSRLQATWPGPVTWLVPVRPSVPAWLCGHHSTLAVRVTAHPVAAALCRVWGRALVSTSANLAGRRPALTALAVRRQLGSQLDYILPGAVGGAKRPTEIRDLMSGCIIRTS
jgi:L-threonylcarbamoyladenylate synthase